MPEFTRRAGSADFNTNPYYNDPKYCGIYPFKSMKVIQCALYAICRTGEIAETPVTAYKNISKRADILKPIFTRNGYGDAIEWWNDTLWEKTTSHKEAKLGDIIVYGSGWGGWNTAANRYYGHVRVIEAMDDNYFYCSGGNESNGKCAFNIKVPRKDGSGDKLSGLVGFIHNPFITPVVAKDETTPNYKELYEKEKALNEHYLSIIRDIHKQTNL